MLDHGWVYKIAYNAINNKERPNYLSRNKNTSTGLDEPVKPKFVLIIFFKTFLSILFYTFSH